MSVTAGWENFFVAEVGAAAALSGLLFVAVSINLRQILAIAHLPARAGETLLIVFSVLVISTFGLVPGQSRQVLGSEIGLTALLVWGVTVRTHLRAYRDLEARRWLATRAVVTQAATLPFVVAGVSLVFGWEHGLVWIVPGTIGSFVSGVLNAWVLLVEIQR